jgi:dipeptidyl aminopeptidase/acylaminoacyl peptidase
MGGRTLVGRRAWIVVTGCVLLVMLAAVARPAEAAFPGTNGKIAYAHAGDIWTIDPDGTGATQITNGSAQDSSPAWSPDGKQVAFSRDGSVYVMEADGTDLHAVFSGPSPALSGRSPAWSPDGTRIAFVNSFALMTVAADGTGAQYVNADFGDCFVEHNIPVSWSPDGTRLISNGAFDCGFFAPGSCVVTIATGATSCEYNGHEESWEDWSPDSRWILVGSGGWMDRGLNYFRAEDVGTEERVVLTPGDAFDGLTENAAWSPDGTTIVFRRDPFYPSTDPSQVYLIDAADGGNLRPLGGPHVGCCYDWQPIPGPQRSDYKNAAKFCEAEREFLGDEAFRQKYGGGANAHGKCVSGS